MAFLDETGLAELWSLIKSADAKAAKIETGTYTGTGTNTASLTFGFEPKFVWIHDGDGLWYEYQSESLNGNLPFIWVQGQTEIQRSGRDESMVITITQNGNTLSWSMVSGFSPFNSSGTTYYYLAIG